jgi:hypothetical protein
MGNAGGELAQARQFLLLDELILCGVQFIEGGFKPIAFFQNEPGLLFSLLKILKSLVSKVKHSGKAFQCIQ